MAFIESEKVDIRRFCGYSAYGSSSTGFSGWRYLTAYGTLEFKMNNLASEEEAVIRTTYLPALQTLELAIPGTGDNLDTDQAAVWYHNKNELRDRERLFDSWRRRLCGFLGLPPGNALGDGGLSMIV